MKLVRLFAYISGVCLFALSGFAAHADTVNLVQNPNFTPSSYSFPGYTGSPNSNSNDITPWVFTSIPAGAGAGGGTGYNPNGFYDHDYDTTRDTVGFIQGSGSLTQTLTGLTIGQTYAYSFLYSERASNYAQTQLLFTVGGLTPALFTAAPSASSFLTASGTFVASATSEDIVFNSSVPSRGDGTSLITNVSVVGVTPEPSSLALLGTGMFSVVAVVRRRMRRA